MLVGFVGGNLRCEKGGKKAHNVCSKHLENSRVRLETNEM